MCKESPGNNNYSFPLIVIVPTSVSFRVKSRLSAPRRLLPTEIKEKRTITNDPNLPFPKDQYEAKCIHYRKSMPL